MAEEGVGAGQGGGEGAGSGSGAGATGAAAGSGAGAGAGSSSAGPGQAGSTTGYTYKEDRGDWFPKHRYDEVNVKYQAESNRARDLERQLTEAQGRIRALAGVEPTDPGQQKLEAVRQQFFQLFPQFAKIAELNEEQLDRLLSAPNAVEAAQAAELRGWTKHGDTSVEYLTDKIAGAYGAESLNEQQSAGVRESFTNWLGAKIQVEIDQSGGRDSATLKRYERGDNSLLDEFVTHFTKQWVEPARRTAVSQETRRIRPVPDSRGRGQVTSTLQRPKENASLDERLDYAVNRLKEQGVQFGR